MATMYTSPKHTLVQKNISDYLLFSGDEVSPHTIQCFVGMCETGEATVDDFECVGGVQLRRLVEDKINA